MNIEERFIRYCRIDTQSDTNNDAVTPSTEKQFEPHPKHAFSF